MRRAAPRRVRGSSERIRCPRLPSAPCAFTAQPSAKGLLAGLQPGIRFDNTEVSASGSPSHPPPLQASSVWAQGRRRMTHFPGDWRVYPVSKPSPRRDISLLPAAPLNPFSPPPRPGSRRCFNDGERLPGPPLRASVKMFTERAPRCGRRTMRDALMPPCR